MKVFIGYDEREHEAYVTAAKTLRAVSGSEPISVPTWRTRYTDDWGDQIRPR